MNDNNVTRCTSCGAWMDRSRECVCAAPREPESIHARRIPGGRGPRPFSLSMYDHDGGRTVYRITPDQSRLLRKQLERLEAGVDVSS